MLPKSEFISISDNLNLVTTFLQEVIISPKKTLTAWAKITNQTPAAKIGYVGQHLASLITGVKGTGTGARGDDLADGTEVKSCNKIDQVDKCKDCGERVLRIEDICSSCGSKNIDRKDDSKWLFTIRDEHELNQYLQMDRVFLLLLDYPKFDLDDFNDIRISAFEIYPKEQRMSVFCDLIKNHYYNIFLPKLENNQKTNPMNLHPWSFQFYKCNPIKTFECIIESIDSNPTINIISYITPNIERNTSMASLLMPSSLLKDDEWLHLANSVSYNTELVPLMLDVCKCPPTFEEWKLLSKKEKSDLIPFIPEGLRKYIPLRPIVSNRQKKHYQR